MENNNDSCKLKRWDLLKARLNNLGPRDAQQFLQAHPNCLILDCRKPEEFVQVRFPTAVNIDYLAYDFWDKMKELDPEQPILVYCNTSRRSIRACTLMKNGGFRATYNLRGGLREWVDTLGDTDLARGK